MRLFSRIVLAWVIAGVSFELILFWFWQDTECFLLAVMCTIAGYHVAFFLD